MFERFYEPYKQHKQEINVMAKSKKNSDIWEDILIDNEFWEYMLQIRFMGHNPFEILREWLYKHDPNILRMPHKEAERLNH